MKPTRTAMLLRKALKDLDSDIKVCHLGYPIGTLTMPDPDSYRSATAFAVDYMSYNIARKREDDKPTSTQMRASLAKWAEAEHRCHVVNQYGWWVTPIDTDKRARIDALFQRTRAIISNVLMDEWPDLDFCPTGGSTTTTSRRFSFGPSKVDGTPLTEETQPHKCAPASRVYLEQMLLNNPGVARRFLRQRYQLLRTTCENVDEPIEMGSYLDPDEIRALSIHLCSNVQPATFDYVSKDYKSVRLLAKSNSLSIMVQKTIGNCIRRALSKVGINLNDQRINQEWAEIGSLTNLVATVDLSSASDSISRWCTTLFPARWQAYINATRDTHVKNDRGTTHKLAMIAGMGNGFIFELQSLLFYAMTRAVVEELKLNTSWISVYGDDIICPVGAVALLQEMFEAKGFIINQDKSFASGPFRESCGKHYFNGVDVTPVYIKSNLDSLQELYHSWNELTSWQHRTGVNIGECLKQILNCIPQSDRNLVPLEWGTKTGLHYPCEGIKIPSKKWNKGLQRYEYTWKVLSPCARVDVYARLPERIQIVDSLIGLECPELVIDPKYFLNILIPKNKLSVTRDRSHCWLLHRAVSSDYQKALASYHRNQCDITECTRGTFGWDVKYTGKKHRSESFGGDA